MAKNYLRSEGTYDDCLREPRSIGRDMPKTSSRHEVDASAPNAFNYSTSGTGRSDYIGGMSVLEMEKEGVEERPKSPDQR